MSDNFAVYSRCIKVMDRKRRVIGRSLKTTRLTISKLLYNGILVVPRIGLPEIDPRPLGNFKKVEALVILTPNEALVGGVKSGSTEE